MVPFRNNIQNAAVWSLHKLRIALSPYWDIFLLDKQRSASPYTHSGFAFLPFLAFSKSAFFPEWTREAGIFSLSEQLKPIVASRNSFVSGAGLGAWPIFWTSCIIQVLEMEG